MLRKTTAEANKLLDILDNSLTRLIETSFGDDLGDVSSFEAPPDWEGDAEAVISKMVAEEISTHINRIPDYAWDHPLIRDYLIRVHPELKEDYESRVTDVIDVYVRDMVYTELLKTISQLKTKNDREKSYL